MCGAVVAEEEQPLLGWFKAGPPGRESARPRPLAAMLERRALPGGWKRAGPLPGAGQSDSLSETLASELRAIQSQRGINSTAAWRPRLASRLTKQRWLVAQRTKSGVAKAEALGS